MAESFPDPTRAPQDAALDLQTRWRCFGCARIGSVRHTRDARFYDVQMAVRRNHAQRSAKCAARRGMEHIVMSMPESAHV